MNLIIQDVQQLRTLLQQQVQFEQQCIDLCNRIEQSAMQVSQILHANQESTSLQQNLQPETPIADYNPSVLNQVMSIEQQHFRKHQPSIGSQWE